MPIDPDLFARKFARSDNAAPPPQLGSRYDGSGQFQFEPGNTVVSHLVVGSETERALADARARYAAMPDAGKLAFTPLESYHMTLFQGIIEGRRKLPYWPSEIALDTPIEQMTALYQERLAGFQAGPAFEVAVTAAVPTGLVVDGVTQADRRALAQWRNQFAEAFGYRHPDHDGYVFHITFAYMIDWIEDADLPSWRAMLDAVEADIRLRAPVLELRAPAFCSFKDMNWFEELRVFEPRS